MGREREAVPIWTQSPECTCYLEEFFQLDQLAVIGLTVEVFHT